MRQITASNSSLPNYYESLQRSDEWERLNIPVEQVKPENICTQGEQSTNSGLEHSTQSNPPLEATFP